MYKYWKKRLEVYHIYILFHVPYKFYALNTTVFRKIHSECDQKSVFNKELMIEIYELKKLWNILSE